MPGKDWWQIGGAVAGVVLVGIGIYCYLKTPTGGVKEDEDEDEDDLPLGLTSDQDMRQSKSKSGGTYANTSNIQIPGFYVIVGRGTAAIVNHTTLRQTKQGQKRLRLVEDQADTLLPVMHIGMEDPWLNYARHGMGQPPYLLNMPGYHEPVAPDEVDLVRTGCSSRKFSASTQREWVALLKKYGDGGKKGIYCMDGWVAVMQSRIDKDKWKDSRGVKELNELADEKINKSKLQDFLNAPYPTGAPPFRLLVASWAGIAEPEIKVIYAHKVDFCTGGGRVRVRPREPDVKDFDGARTPPWIPSSDWPKDLLDRPIIHGVDGLTERTPFPKAHRICVYGAGGIGLNQIERAHDLHDEGPCIDWYGREHIGNTPTLALRRNDTVLKGYKKDYMDPGDADAGRTEPAKFDPDFATIPGNPKWRFGNYCKIRVELAGKKGHMSIPEKKGFLTDAFATPVLNDKRLEYRLHDKQQVGDAGFFPFLGDYAGVHKACCAAAENGKAYDRVIVCLGQEGNQAGEPARIAWFLTFNAIVDATGGYFVGLQAAAETVRILGAAAVMYPQAATKAGYQGMENYRLTLPASAVLPGFILAGHNIAAANGFFTDKPNKNVNTVTMAELVTLLKDGGLDQDPAEKLAGKIIERRRWRNDGFSSIDMLLHGLGKAEAQAVEASELSIGYPMQEFL